MLTTFVPYRHRRFWFDPTLRERAAAEPTVELRHGWTCEGFEDSESVDGRSEDGRLAGGRSEDGRLAGGADDGVALRLASETYGKRSVRARYLVACDGAGSPIRKALGIGSLRDSADVRARWQGAYVRLPGLRRNVPHAPAVQYYLLNPRRMILGSLDGGDLWRVTYPLADGESPAPADVRATVAGALDGAADEVEILDTREWTGDAVVAESFRAGHVLLAGDAAHRMWPSGGHGMNTGLGDVANLGWKLEAVLRGRSPDTLLDTYTAERRPHAERLVRRAWHNYRADKAIRPDPALDDPAESEARVLAGERITATRRTEWRSLGVQLDVRYDSSPLIVPDGTPDPPADPEAYVPTARPGHRAPHFTLADGRSVLDLFRGRFTLLNFAPAVDSGALARAFRNRGIPLDEEWAGAPGACPQSPAWPATPGRHLSPVAPEGGTGGAPCVVFSRPSTAGPSTTPILRLAMHRTGRRRPRLAGELRYKAQLGHARFYLGAESYGGTGLPDPGLWRFSPLARVPGNLARETLRRNVPGVAGWIDQVNRRDRHAFLSSNLEGGEAKFTPVDKLTR
ncbi:FAD-dependent monooxygenase [Streptomyces sp. NBC_01506]|uniref:FAD-dependent monooxygenase n=1 Tax=Streptomyces sp. NBC_01506 TaxID=2903887 RepID=UPI003866A5C2